MTSNGELFSMAFKLHTFGYSVIPSGAGKNGKSPSVTWEAYQKQCPTDDDLTRWHETLRPHLWGVVTGKVSGVVVIDADVKEAVERLESWGLKPNVHTPRGGRHYWIQHPGFPVITKAGILPSVDIRGDGGFVNVIGERRAYKDGDKTIPAGEYEIVEMPSPDKLIPWRMVPPQLLAAIQAKPQIAAPVTPGNIPQGSRNDRLFRLASGMRRQGASEDTIFAAVKKCYDTDCSHDPPMDDNELRTVSKQGAKYAPEASPEDFATPKVTPIPAGYVFHWDNSISVKVDRLTDDCEAIITVYEKSKGIHVSRINLLAPRSLTELSNKLAKVCKLPWDAVLSHIAIFCSEQQSALGIPVDISVEPKTMAIDYLLDPLFPLNQPTTLFTAGGKGKSIFADYFAILVQYGIPSHGNLPFVPANRGNVLYLDWEADEETHRRYVTAIKHGLGITDHSFIHYLEMDHPLTHVADAVRDYIQHHDIAFVIIDSQMAATSGTTRGMNEAQLAGEYYNTLRSFHVTSLTIDHITKQSMSAENGSEAPYGSIVKYNRSRSQWELRLPDDEEDADDKEYALVHRKFNLGRKSKPIGVYVHFTNHEDTLTDISFGSQSIKDSPSLSDAVLSWKARIATVLQRKGPLSPSDVASALSQPHNLTTIAKTLSRGTSGSKAWCVLLDNGSYGLLDNCPPV